MDETNELPKKTADNMNSVDKRTTEDKNEDLEVFHFKPIGKIRSCFTEKNGTPRQGILCPESKAILQLDFGVPNPEHSLEGLESFSHVWLIFVFHENTPSSVKNKVKPPRLEGKKVGLFASRTPHRPNPVGLSVAKLDRIEGSTLYLSGIDLVNGTPIIDIKPYIPAYDSQPVAITPSWIIEAPRPRLNQVVFTEKALDQLKQLLPKLKFYDTLEHACQAIQEVLIQDPRSVYLKENWDEWQQTTYGFCIDILNVLAQFHPDKTVTVTEVEDWSHKKKYTANKDT